MAHALLGVQGRRRAVNISKTAKGLTTALVVLAMVGGVVTACSSDENPGSADSGSGGAGAGAGGKATGGSAGKNTGGCGATGGNGCQSSGGTSNGGSGGTATGGSGGKAHDGGQDGDAGCVPPQGFFYDKPGCNGAVAPVCAGPAFDACAISVCACDGQTIIGCGFYDKPFAYVGECNDGGGTDAGKDGGDGG
jgi:hypothetical protein